MNIFFLDWDQRKLAKSQCDKHAVKMPVETVHMLCCAAILTGISTGKGLYQPVFINHPMNVWVRSSLYNYEWTWSLAQVLLDEYYFRYGRIHASQKVLDRLPVSLSSSSLNRTKFTIPPRCMPKEYKKGTDIIGSYRAYYKGEKARFARWEKGRNPPDWW